ncbi:MAG TPA: carboxypeptidase regulatory-like domain-containing protein, partial [Anaerolineae bacterium]|nr:carboxypeptidase regulatory-like domain-containing protein [Anaerolineae bacterium]
AGLTAPDNVICGAELFISLRANYYEASNPNGLGDTIGFAFSDADSGQQALGMDLIGVFQYPIGEQPTGSGFLPYIWGNTNNPQTATVTIDLAQFPHWQGNGKTVNLLPRLNAAGLLDLWVQDDTGVDYASLHLDYCAATRSEVGEFNYFDDTITDTNPATPSAGLSTYVTGTTTAPIVGVDAPEGVLAHTFTGLTNVCGGLLTMRLRPSGNPVNDTIKLGWFDVNGQPLAPAWSSQLSSQILGWPQTAVDPLEPPEYILTLDLANLHSSPNENGPFTDLTDTMNQYGYLDVIVGDHTSVDFIWLDVVHCCDFDSAIPDVGDAPDSSNNAGLPMLTYSNTVTATFPTVFIDPNSTLYGMYHNNFSAEAWLGTDISGENEADFLPDDDGIPNISAWDNVADRDGADDGVLLATIDLPTCGTTSFDFNVYKNPAGSVGTWYLNVWFDFNRDGDWDDLFTCLDDSNQTVTVYEWAVADHVIVPSGGLEKFTTPSFTAASEAGTQQWLRVTLSSIALPPNALNPTTELGDGRGPIEGFEFGETEDYLIDIPAVAGCGVGADGFVTGTVTDSDSGSPLANVNVAAFRQDNGGNWIPAGGVNTNSSGQYTLTLPADTIYHLYLTQPHGTHQPQFYNGTTIENAGGVYVSACSATSGLTHGMQAAPPPASDYFDFRVSSISHANVDNFWRVSTGGNFNIRLVGHHTES